MFKSFEHFKKSTQNTHKFLLETGSTIKLSVLRDKLAKESGFVDINSLKAYFETLNEPKTVYSVICHFGGNYDSLEVFHDEKSADDYFKQCIIDHGILEGSDEFNEALEFSYIEIGKLEFELEFNRIK